ncbi:MAG: hypothetical protein HY755_00185 [Nitrospirae bacterium]|nr:hypothetical protein [Nitrospirota bacterium]
MLLVTCYLLLLAGCGYKFQGRETLPFDSVRIGKIENKTVEPKLEDKLHRALAEELTKYGITITKSAEHIISGVIESFELKPLSEKEGLAVEYEIVIKGRFFLTRPDGKIIELRNKGAFIVSFYSGGNIQEIMASKEQAIENALKNLSSEIRAGIAYK